MRTLLVISTAICGIAFLPLDVLGAPLFDDDAPIAVRLEGPLTTLLRERSDEEELAATMVLPGADGTERSVDVAIRARGNYRRRKDNCQFPPVRLNFRTSQLGGTVFEAQDKLKLVTHCSSSRDYYEQHVLREFLTYRLLQTLTERSFRVRLLHVTYVDREDDGKSVTKFGFVIEDDEALAGRLGLEALETDKLGYEDLDPAFSNLVMVFEYLIGNTDFSLIRGPEGEHCCHNSLPLGNGTTIYPVPYDFDLSGMVDAPYAAPDPRMKIRSVRDRVYRGRCSNNQLLPATLAQFEAAREAMFGAVEALPQLDKRNRSQVVRYLESFFKTLGNPALVEREFIRGCS